MGPPYLYGCLNLRILENPENGLPCIAHQKVLREDGMILLAASHLLTVIDSLTPSTFIVSLKYWNLTITIFLP
jgi:hypothetical protein